MIASIRAKNIGIIKEVEVDLSKGLCVVTGETGAGKTLFTQSILASFGYINGNELIGNHGDTAYVELMLEANDELRKRLGLQDNELIIRRVFSKEGKTKSFLNGMMVPMSMLKDIGSCLVAIHSQNSQLGLLKKSNQMALIDSFDVGLVNVLKEYEFQWRKVNEVLKEIRLLEESSSDFEKQKEIFMYQKEEIERACLKLGEEEQLKALREKLRHKRQIIESVSQAAALIRGDDNSAGICLAKASHLLVGLGRIDEEFAKISERLVRTTIEVEDIYHDLIAQFNQFAEEEMDLDAIENRLSIIEQMKKKYGTTVEDVIKYHSEIDEKLGRLTQAKDKLNELRKHLNKEFETLIGLGKQLTLLRKRSVKRFVEKVREKIDGLMLSYLEFNASFESLVNVSDVSGKVEEILPHIKKGFESIEMMIKNAGGDFSPLAVSASGGELSRILLSIETVLGQHSSISTYIFDEVDAGVGGNAAIQLGKYLKELAKHSQVICVTHLTQVAACGDTHFAVRRIENSNPAEAKVVEVRDEERVEELARMLSGKVAREKAIEHARELVRTLHMDKVG